MTLGYSPTVMPLVLRSMMYTPGNNPRLIQKARTLTADATVLDLEDSVPLDEKPRARATVRDSIKLVCESGADVYVRVNAWDTGLTEGDLEAIVQDGLDGVVLPKTETERDITALDRKLTGLEQQRGLRPGTVAVQPIIETARGVMNAQQALADAGSRVKSVAFGAVDYTRDMRVQLTREGWEVFHARAHVAMVARAFGLLAVDSAWPAFADTEGFRKDSQTGKQLGYEGRIVIHPSQIEVAHAIYTPTSDEVEYAREIVTVFEKGVERGLASVPLRGKMLDWPVYRTAREVLATAELIAKKEQRKQARMTGA